MAYITGTALDDAKIEERFAKALLTNAEVDEGGWFVTYLKQSRDFVGIAKLTPYEDNPTVYEVGYGSLPEFWKMGLGTEMLECMIGLGKFSEEIHELVGVVSEDNTWSVRLLAQAGFKPIAEHAEEKGVQIFKLVLDQ